MPPTETNPKVQRPGELIPPGTLSAEIEVPEKTLAQWRYRSEGPPYLKLGGHVRYRRSDVDAWLRSCERGDPNGVAA